MSTRTSLAQMVEDLWAEIGASMEPGHNTSEIATHKYLLRRVQKELYTAHDWPNLVMDEYVTVPAGDKYLPDLSSVSYEQINEMWSAVGSQWLPMAYGIGPEHYSQYPSGTSAATVKRYRFDPVANKIEVWPTPSANVDILVRGQQALSAMTLDTDLSTLDGTLIVLFAAAEILAKNKREDASLKLSKAQAHLRAIRANLASHKARVTSMTGRERTYQRPGLDYIPQGS